VIKAKIYKQKYLKLYMHYIKDVFQNKKTDHAHNKFIRYSKGEFVGPLMVIRISKNNIKIGASVHYADELLKILSEHVKNEVVHIKGSVVWNQDLGDKLLVLGIKYSKVSKSRGIFKYILDNDVRLKDFYDSFGQYNIIANIKGEDYSFVTKTTFPKPNKEFGPDFCKVTLPASFTKQILDEFAFDVKAEKIKVIKIFHKLNVTNINLPEKITDFDEARRQATREGTIERTTLVDDVENKLEINFKV
jgi:hypothetical protein